MKTKTLISVFPIFIAASCGQDDMAPQLDATSGQNDDITVVAQKVPASISLDDAFFYEVDLNVRSSNSLKVKLLVRDLISTKLELSMTARRTNSLFYQTSRPTNQQYLFEHGAKTWKDLSKT